MSHDARDTGADRDYMGEAMATVDVPTMECPRCHAVLPNYDGFGVLAHVGEGGCGYCSHPSRHGDGHGNWTCDYCGDVKYNPPIVPGCGTCPAPETCADVCVAEEAALLSHASWLCPDCGREVRARNGLVVGNRCDVCEMLERR